MTPRIHRFHPRTAAVGVPFVLGLLVIALLAPVVASASDPTDAQYGSSVVQVEGQGGGGSNPAPSAGSDSGSGIKKDLIGGLPFTGLDVIALAAVALALTAMGILLRRFSAEPPEGV